MDTLAAPAAQSQANVSSRYLKVVDVAELMSVPASTVYDLARQGRIAGVCRARLSPFSFFQSRQAGMNRAQAKQWRKLRRHISARPRRLLVSHCPGCCEPLEQPAMLGGFADGHGTHVVVYYLCAGCARELDLDSKSFSARVEQNLMRLGGYGHAA